MSYSNSQKNINLYERLIEEYKQGSKSAEGKLRNLLSDFAEDMPKEVLIDVSTIILIHRKEEFQNQLREN